VEQTAPVLSPLGSLCLVQLGAIAASFVVSYFNLFNVARFGLPGELIIAIIGALILVVIVRLFTPRRTGGASV
jgi:uncharacterized membrane protein YeaQ/YmgE (transglycosylase-associated protein family)